MPLPPLAARPTADSHAHAPLDAAASSSVVTMMVEDADLMLSGSVALLRIHSSNATLSYATKTTLYSQIVS